MTNEMILKLARESGFHSANILRLYEGKMTALCESEFMELQSIHQFAHLVAAHEREACEERVVDLFADMETPYLPDITRAIRNRSTPKSVQTKCKEMIACIDEWLANQESTCSNKLRLQGKPYPRTCKKCGLGPCVAERNANGVIANPTSEKPDFCDNHCTWLDHHPDCTNAPSAKDLNPVAYLTPRMVDSFMREDLGYETCSNDDYAAFPVYRHPAIAAADEWLASAEDIEPTCKQDLHVPTFKENLTLQRISAAYNMASHGSIYLEECEYGNVKIAFDEVIAILEAVMATFPAEPKAAPAAKDVEPILPHDIVIGGNIFRKGVRLSTFILAAQNWHREAYKEGYELTQEQKAANFEKLITVPTAKDVEPDWEKLYRLALKSKEMLVAKYERDTGRPLTRIYPMDAPPAAKDVVWSDIESMAAERYKVVPAHESMFYRHAVVAGTGTQQLYIGREAECENMARKFVGAFLDGAYVAINNTQPPDTIPASVARQALEAMRSVNSYTYTWACVEAIETLRQALEEK